MDNVACYGSEDKLIDCTFNTETSEDVHSNDIWVKCSSVTEKSMSTTNNTGLTIPTEKGISTASSEQEKSTGLIIPLVAVCVLLLVMVVIISVLCLYVCKRGTKTRSGTDR